MEPDRTAEQFAAQRTLRRGLWANALATSVLFLVVVCVVIYVLITAQTNKNALCNFVSDIEHRATASQEFLDMTPSERVKKFGPAVGSMPESVIENQLANQRKTIESLSELNC